MIFMDTLIEKVKEKRYYMKGVLQGFEETNARIRLENAQIVLWPIKFLPEDARLGGEVSLHLSTQKTETEESQRIAKELLNEILHE